MDIRNRKELKTFAAQRLEQAQQEKRIVLIYAVLVLVTTFAFNPVSWLLTAAGVVASHVWYGVRFLQGLCAKRAPCEFIGKDHAQGKEV